MKITPAILRLMDPKDRASLGIVGLSNQEAGQKPRRRRESDEQGVFANWLKIQKEKGALLYVWHGTHKASTATVGTPDFIVALPEGKTLWIEMKVSGNQESNEQKAFREKLLGMNHIATVSHCADDAIGFVRLHQSVL